MASVMHAGRCLCGDLRFEAQGPWRNLCFCHCESCRLAAGGPFVAWGSVDPGGFHLVQGELSIVRSSKDVERGFCGRCGTAVTYAHANRPGDVDITLATLEDSSDLAPQFHIWVQDKLPWVQILDGLPKYDSVPG